MVKDYTFLFKGGKFMDNFEKIEEGKLGEVEECIRLEKHKCIKCGKAFWTHLEDHDRNPYCYECRNKGVKPEVSKYKKVIQNPILLETKN